MDKIIFYILLMYVTVFAKENKSFDNEAIELIYLNKTELYNFYSNCNYMFLGKVKPCNFNGKNEFLLIINEPLSVWNKNNKMVFKSFIYSCGIIGWFDKNHSFVINNDLYISILISLLKCNSVDSKSYSNSALEILLNKTSYPLLKMNSTRIKEALQFNKSDSNNKLRLLSLLDLSKEEREQLLKDQNIPLEIRARLGDSLSVDTLINKFIKETTYDKKRKYIKDLIYIGADRCIKKLIVHFNQPYFNVIRNSKTDSCVEESIRYPILMGLRQIYPENALFNEKLQNFNPNYNGFNKQEEVIYYLKEFTSWANNKYGVVPADPDPVPVLKSFCRLH